MNGNSSRTPREVIAAASSASVTPTSSSISPAGQQAAQSTAQTQSPSNKLPHVTVSRAHSFPKSSPLAAAGLDYQVRPGSQGVTRSPNVTVGQGSPTGGVTVPPTRGTTSSSRCHTHSSQSNGSVRSSSHVAGVSQPTLSGISNEKPTSSRSPRTSRKSAERKHRDRDGDRHRERTRDREHREREGGAPSPPTTHSMLTNSSITPPNVVIGAMGGETPTTSHKDKEKDRSKPPVSYGFINDNPIYQHNGNKSYCFICFN